MWKYLIILVILFSNCQKSVHEFELPKKEHINQIIDIVIHSDSLPKLGYYINSEAISTELKKSNIAVNELLTKKIKNQYLFNSKDSIYLKFQNKNLSKFILDKDITGKIKQIDLKLLDKHELYVSRYYCLSIPYFSLDKSKAYITVTHECPYMCSSAYACFLEKQNGKWKIIKTELLWIS